MAVTQLLAVRASKARVEIIVTTKAIFVYVVVVVVVVY